MAEGQQLGLFDNGGNNNNLESLLGEVRLIGDKLSNINTKVNSMENLGVKLVENFSNLKNFEKVVASNSYKILHEVRNTNHEICSHLSSINNNIAGLYRVIEQVGHNICQNNGGNRGSGGNRGRSSGGSGGSHGSSQHDTVNAMYNSLLMLANKKSPLDELKKVHGQYNDFSEVVQVMYQAKKSVDNRRNNFVKNLLGDTPLLTGSTLLALPAYSETRREQDIKASRDKLESEARQSQRVQANRARNQQRLSQFGEGVIGLSGEVLYLLPEYSETRRQQRLDRAHKLAGGHHLESSGVIQLGRNADNDITVKQKKEKELSQKLSQIIDNINPIDVLGNMRAIEVKKQKENDKNQGILAKAILSFLPGGGGINNVLRMVSADNPIMATASVATSGILRGIGGTLKGILGGIGKIIQAQQLIQDIVTIAGLLIISGMPKIIEWVKEHLGGKDKAKQLHEKSSQKISKEEKTGTSSIDYKLPGDKLKYTDTVNSVKVARLSDLDLKGTIASSNTLPTVYYKNAPNVQALDKYLKDKGYDVTYTSAMGGHDPGTAHYLGKKLDFQLFRGGKPVHLTDEEVKELTEAGFFSNKKNAQGKIIGAQGWEAHPEQVGGGHYDASIDYKIINSKSRLMQGYIEYTENLRNKDKQEEQKKKREQEIIEKGKNLSITSKDNDKSKEPSGELTGDIALLSPTGNDFFDSQMKFYSIVGMYT